MIYILVIFIAMIIFIDNRVNYSRYVCHATNFRTKLLKMGRKDHYWLDVYDNLPDLKKMSRITKNVGAVGCLTEEQRLRYFEYDLMEKNT